MKRVKGPKGPKAAAKQQQQEEEGEGEGESGSGGGGSDSDSDDSGEEEDAFEARRCLACPKVILLSLAAVADHVQGKVREIH